MTYDDRPDQHELSELARRGREELGRFDRARDATLWTGIESELESRPRTSWRDRLPFVPMAAAAAVALVVGVVAGGLLGRSVVEAPTTLATIQLAPLADTVEPTTAALQQRPDGRTIQLDLTDLPPTDGFHEVWLLDPDTGALVSLGPARADGTYVVPATVDLVELPVLDVSVEPRDGDPTHSGDSLLRGDVTWVG